MSIRRVLMTGDHQCGSAFGLWQPGIKQGYQLNVLQDYLWRCWEHQRRHMPRLDTIVIMGECVEGPNSKEDAAMIAETDLSRQVSGFVACIEPLLARLNPGGHVYVMASSRYHSGPAARSDSEVGERLALLSRGQNWTLQRDQFKRACHSWLHFSEDGVLFDCAHHRSGAQVNRSMPMEREGRYNAMIADLLQDGQDDVIVRSHTHTDVIVSEGYRTFAGLPPWKYEDDFVMRGAVPNRTVTRYFGSLVFEVDGDAKRKGGDPIARIRKFFYRHPTIARFRHADAAGD